MRSDFDLKAEQQADVAFAALLVKHDAATCKSCERVIMCAGITRQQDRERVTQC